MQKCLRKFFSKAVMLHEPKAKNNLSEIWLFSISLDVYKKHLQEQPSRVFWKYAANLQENIHAELWFQSCFEPLDGCFCTYHLDEHSLRIVHRDRTSSFHKLVQKGHSFAIHYRNIQRLATELHKIRVLHITSMRQWIVFFSLRTLKYNLRIQTIFFRNSVNCSKFSQN